MHYLLWIDNAFGNNADAQSECRCGEIATGLGDDTNATFRWEMLVKGRAHLLADLQTKHSLLSRHFIMSTDADVRNYSCFHLLRLHP